jgi:hypothetical protein
MFRLAVASAAPIPVPPPKPTLRKRAATAVGNKVKRGLGCALGAIFLGLPFLTFACSYWLINQTIRGKFRNHLRALWVACSAWYLTPWTPWAWVAAGLVLACAPEPSRWIGDRAWVSDREMGMLARACALLAGWQILTPNLPWQYRGGSFVVVVVAGLARFWWSRYWRRPDGPWWRVSSWRTPYVEPGLSFVEIWHKGIAESVDKLAGEFLEADDDTGSYLIRLDNTLASEAATLDAYAEKAAHEFTGLPYPRGSITLSNPPSMPSPAYLRVTVSSDPDTAVSRITYFDGPTLGKDGRYLAGYSRAGAPVYGRLWRVGGGANFLAFGVPGSGKGGAMRTHLSEAVLSPYVFGVGLDCKGVEGEDDVFRGGAGIPEVAAGLEFYGRDKDAWEVGFLLTVDILAARAGRYSDAGQSKWYPDLAVDGYCDPMWLMAIDEIAIFVRAFPQFKGKFGELLALQRSFGMGTAGTSQNGQAPEFFGVTKIRSDWRGNGITYAGHVGDTQARTAAQSDWNISYARLPKGQWQFPLNKIDHGVSTDPIRWRYLPSAVERDHEGLSGEFGIAEEWMERRAPAKLHSQDEDIFSKWMERLGAKANPVANAGKPEPALEPVRETVEVAAGVHVEAPARILHAVPTQPLPDTTPALDLIPKIVREGGVMTRGEIAEAAGIKPEYASDRLKKLKEMGVMTEARTADGRPGWRVVA